MKGAALEAASSTGLGRAAARFYGKSPEHQRHLRGGGWLKENAPFCDPVGTNPIAIMGRCPLHTPWNGRGCKGFGYAERDVR